MNERAINRKAFLSHSHSDHATAKALAEALRTRGVDSWLDEWEIQPGDSLVQKIFEEGLRECGVFLVLLSQASAASRWVREELNVALIRRIEGNARVIPILVERCEIPTALTPLLRLELDAGLDAVAQRVADVIFGIRNIPPLAPPPSTLKFAIPGLSPLAARVAVHLFGGPDGPPSDLTQFHGKQLASDLSLSAEEVNDAIDELEIDGDVKAVRVIGTLPYSFAVVMPTYRLAFRLRGTPAIAYDPDADLRLVANAVVNHSRIDGKRLTEATGLPSNRINAAVQYLEDEEVAKVFRVQGGGPFMFMQVNATSATRRFVAANAQL